MKHESKKLENIEGLRGIASFSVMIFHLRLYFAPGGGLKLSTWESASDVFMNSIKLIINGANDGGLAVYIFWIISGYTLTQGYFNSKNIHYLRKALLKRYFRLAIPVLASVLIAYLLMAGGFFKHKEAIMRLGPSGSILSTFYNFDPDLLDALKSGLFDSFLVYDKNTSYNRVLWIMPAEFKGSILILFLLALFGKTRTRLTVYFILACGFFFKHSWWYIAILLGSALCHMHKSGDYSNSFRVKPDIMGSKSVSRYRSLMLFCLLICGLTLSGLSIYFSFRGLLFLISAIIIVYVVFESDIIKKFLALYPAQVLGKISFSLYLVHVPIICSITSSFALYIFDISQNDSSIILAIAASIPLAFTIAYCYYRAIDLPAMELANKFGDQLSNSIQLLEENVRIFLKITSRNDRI